MSNEIESMKALGSLDFRTAVSIGSYIGELENKVKKYENIIHAIANIDTMFILPDGTDREWNSNEALEEIEKLVTPVWNEYCHAVKHKSNKN